MIGSIVGILLLIGGISIYRTFALYEEKKTFDVLKGTVPDFVYKEDILNGAYPVLKSKTGEKLIPIVIDEETGKVKKADIKDEWYSYADKKWANAVILADGIEEPKNDEEIPEEHIESYFVWIPKYKYKIFDMGEYENSNETINANAVQSIEIQFGLKDTQDDVTNEKGEKECATPMLSGESGKCKKGDWMTHPAFLAFDTDGLWIGKFETGYKDAKNATEAKKNMADKTQVIIKPNVYSWRNITVGNAYQTSYDYQRGFDSHMMKNTEWGAVAYLSHSKYGTCDDGTCKKVENNTNTDYLTGFSKNIFSNSTDASTTGNNTGIFDMNGGAWEMLAGVKTTAANGKETSLDSIQFGSSELTKDSIVNQKYIDLYTDGSGYDRRILGDATGELGPFSKSISSWYGNFAQFIGGTGYWFNRGGFRSESTAGIFNFGPFGGGNKDYITFRVVLAPSLKNQQN